MLFATSITLRNNSRSSESRCMYIDRRKLRASRRSVAVASRENLRSAERKTRTSYMLARGKGIVEPTERRPTARKVSRRMIISPESCLRQICRRQARRRRPKDSSAWHCATGSGRQALPTKNPIGHACPAGGPGYKLRYTGSTTTSRPSLTYL